MPDLPTKGVVPIPEKITSIAALIIGLAVVAVIFTSPRSAGVIRAIGGTFVGALRSAATAGRR